MWAVALIDECNTIAVRLGRVYPTFLNAQKEAEYSTLAIHIARTYKSALEVIGNLLYQFNPQRNYPQSLEKDVEICLEHLKQVQGGKISASFDSEKVKLIANRVGEDFLLIFGGCECFKLLYLKGLVNFYEIMSRSPSFMRMARSLKLLVLKTYLSITKPERL
jgi:hypothetical protein